MLSIKGRKIKTLIPETQGLLDLNYECSSSRKVHKMSYRETPYRYCCYRGFHVRQPAWGATAHNTLYADVLPSLPEPDLQHILVENVKFSTIFCLFVFDRIIYDIWIISYILIYFCFFFFKIFYILQEDSKKKPLTFKIYFTSFCFINKPFFNF